jgi:hypothetical protein
MPMTRSITPIAIIAAYLTCASCTPAQFDQSSFVGTYSAGTGFTSYELTINQDSTYQYRVFYDYDGWHGPMDGHWYRVGDTLYLSSSAYPQILSAEESTVSNEFVSVMILDRTGMLIETTMNVRIGINGPEPIFVPRPQHSTPFDSIATGLWAVRKDFASFPTRRVIIRVGQVKLPYKVVHESSNFFKFQISLPSSDFTHPEFFLKEPILLGDHKLYLFTDGRFGRAIPLLPKRTDQ